MQELENINYEDVIKKLNYAKNLAFMKYALNVPRLTAVPGMEEIESNVLFGMTLNFEDHDYFYHFRNTKNKTFIDLNYDGFYTLKEPIKLKLFDLYKELPAFENQYSSKIEFTQENIERLVERLKEIKSRYCRNSDSAHYYDYRIVLSFTFYEQGNSDFTGTNNDTISIAYSKVFEK